MPQAPTALSCAGGVTAHLHGLTVSPSLTPQVALQWQSNPPRLPGRKSPAVTPGGLRLFQFALSGTITVNLGVSVSGSGTCAMTLPAVVRSVPAGELGTLVLRLNPTLRLVTSGELDVMTSATLTCDVSYRRYNGAVSRTNYCTAARPPLRFSSLAGADATVTGTVGVSAALDDLSAVTGTVDAGLRAAYHPGGGLVAQADAWSAFDLTAPLGDRWPGAPRVTVANGTAFSGRLGNWDGPPPSATGPTAIAVSPGLAYPWSTSVCGYDTPTFGSDVLTVAGHGFLPGEQAGIAAGWAAYPGLASAGSDGSFAASEPVGEVPSVLDRWFSVAADGTAGSVADSAIELDADGCLLQQTRGTRLSVRWGGNGFDPDAPVSLSVNGTALSTASTDGFGSGGTTATFACPAEGRYAWQVAGTVNGVPAAAAGWLTCAAHSVSPLYPGTAGTRRTGAAATLATLRQPAIHARPPLPSGPAD
jgi:hypothetical protein